MVFHGTKRFTSPHISQYLVTMKTKNFNRVGSEKQYDPRLAGEVLHDYLENSNEPLAVAYREHAETEDQEWHRNTDLGIDLKTILHSDTHVKTGRDYQGVLCLDQEAEIEEFRCRDAHYTFIETVPPAPRKRNPHVFKGQYITVTRREDGSLRANFRPLKIDKDFSVEQYAIGVSNELLWAFEGLVDN